jgi:hypothetical protein
VLLPLGVAIYFGLSDSAEISRSSLSLIMFAPIIRGWQHHRLRMRVDALSKLLTEIGYPGEA